jgi:PKD domain
MLRAVQRGCPAGLRHRVPAADEGFVASPPRSSSLLADLRSLAALRSAAASCLAGLCVCAFFLLGLAPAPAGALVTPIGSPQFGVEPHSVTPFTAEPTLPLTYHGGPVMHSNKTYAIYWDPTQNPANQYDGDWKSLINQYFQDVATASGSLGNVNAVTSLYTDSTGGHAGNHSAFLGASTDRTAYPVSGQCTDPHPTAESLACLTDAQLRTELTSFVSGHGLPTGLGTIFFLFTPPGVTVCTDGGTASGHCSDSEPGAGAKEKTSFAHSFCSYHSFIGSGAGTIVYAAQPWTAGTLGTFDAPATPHGEPDCQSNLPHQQEPNQLPGLDSDGDFDSGLPDVIINEISVEQIATVTDPLLNGWYAPIGQANEGNEMPDQCRNWFEPELGGSIEPEESKSNDSKAGTLFNQFIASHHYYLNTEYDQVALSEDFPGVACIPSVSLVPTFTVPGPVNNGEVIGLDASQSNVSLGATNYMWSFGDGSNPVSGVSNSSVFHAFTYGGTYQVSLTVTDGGGNTASVTNPVTVIGPPPPAPEPAVTGQTAGTSSAAASSGAGGSSGASGGGGAKATVNPAATASIASRSLRNVLRTGLVVRYSVNEKVTGRFEVFLATSVARRIGLHGAAATGLAKGTAPQTVIGRAILVTTTGGRSSVKIQFDKATAGRLHRLHNASLMLRLIVRNSSAGTTTVLSTIALSG